MSLARAARAWLVRLFTAWRVFSPEQRLAAGAAIGLFLALFLPWYQETVVAAGKTTSASLTGWAAFSFVEAVVLVLAAAVLALLFARAEGHAFRVPGGDGRVVTAVGGFTCVLVVWRILDKQGAQVRGPAATASGVEWGIFVALALAALLTYAGSRMRMAGIVPPPPTEERQRGSRPSRRAQRPAPSAKPAPRNGQPGPSGPAPSGWQEFPDGVARWREGSGASDLEHERSDALDLPVPDALEDPPSLHFKAGRPRSQPSGHAADTAPTQVAAEPLPPPVAADPLPPRADEEPTRVLDEEPTREFGEQPTQLTDDQLTIPFDDDPR